MNSVRGSGAVNNGNQTVATAKKQIEQARTRPPMRIAFSGLPAGLCAIPNWIPWKYIWRDGWAKLPCEYIGYRRDGVYKERLDKGNGYDPKHWSDFESVVSRVVNHHEFWPQLGREPIVGIGFCVSRETGTLLIDLDNCRNRETGEINEFAQRIIDRINSYTEKSPSGTGVKIWVKATLPAGHRTKRKDVPGFEIYTRKFGALTGDRLAGTPDDVHDRQAEVEQLYAEMLPEKEFPLYDSDSSPPAAVALRRDYGDKLLDNVRCYMSRVPGAVSGQGGHDATFKAACILINGFALSVSDAWPIFSEWNVSCSPPWSDKDLLRKLHEAERAGSRGKPRGYLLNNRRDRFAEEFSGPEWDGVEFELSGRRGPRPIDFVQPLAYVAATIGNVPAFPLSADERRDRRRSMMADFEERPAGWEKVKDKISAHEQELKDAARRSSVILGDLYRAFDCEKSVSLTLLDPNSLDTFFATVGCNAWKCSGCANRLKRKWSITTRYFLTLPTLGGNNQPVGVAKVLLSDWPTLWKRYNRTEDLSGKVGYFMFKPDGANGDFAYIFTNAVDILDDQPEFRRLPGAKAAQQIAAMLSGYSGESCPISASQNWKLVKKKTPAEVAADKERKRLHGLTTVGLTHKNVTVERLEQFCRDFGSELENVSSQFNCGADKHVKSVLRVKCNPCGGRAWLKRLHDFALYDFYPDELGCRRADDPSRITETELPTCEQWTLESEEQGDVEFVPGRKGNASTGPPSSNEIDLAEISL